jgi:hypothetical protein
MTVNKQLLLLAVVSCDGSMLLHLSIERKGAAMLAGVCVLFARLVVVHDRFRYTLRCWSTWGFRYTLRCWSTWGRVNLLNAGK